MSDNNFHAAHLAFIVPVRHHENSRDWSRECETLLATTRSIAAQEEPGWTAVVVCNRESPLPELPDGVNVERVDFAPNSHHDIKAHDFETAMSHFKLDKGQRVLAGMRALPEAGYYMIVDGDDLVSRNLSGFVKSNQGGAGWFVADGYAINHAGRWAYKITGNFHKTAGTSHIVRRDLYRIPPEDDPTFVRYISVRLGSHGAITELFADDGYPLAPLPFPGAAYIVGHPNSHSQSKTLLRQYILNKDSLRRPWTLPRKLAAVTLLGAGFAAEFYGNVVGR